MGWWSYVGLYGPWGTLNSIQPLPNSVNGTLVRTIIILEACPHCGPLLISL